MNSYLLFVILIAACLARAKAQDSFLPPQCDPIALLEAKNVLFMGNASSIQVGMYIKDYFCARKLFVCH
jgi:hypothetical protein